MLSSVLVSAIPQLQYAAEIVCLELTTSFEFGPCLDVSTASGLRFFMFFIAPPRDIEATFILTLRGKWRNLFEYIFSCERESGKGSKNGEKKLR